MLDSKVFKFEALSATAALFLFAVPAMAGHSGGNGGVVHVCPGKVELHDLYRGRVEMGLVIRETAEPVVTQLNRALGKLTSHFAYQENLKAALKEVQVAYEEHSVLGRPGVPLVRSRDEEAIAPESGCEMRQLAIYSKEGLLVVQPELMKEIQNSPTQLAAFFLHESTARIGARKLGQLTTVQAQRLVALLMAEGNHDERVTALLAQQLPGKMPYTPIKQRVRVSDDSEISIRFTIGAKATQIDSGVSLVFASGGAAPLLDYVTTDLRCGSRDLMWPWQSVEKCPMRAERNALVPYGPEGIRGSTLNIGFTNSYYLWSSIPAKKRFDKHTCFRIQILDRGKVVADWRSTRDMINPWNVPLFQFE